MPLSPAVARWELARRLRQRRLELGIGAAAITRQLDVSAAYWSHIENERNLVPEDKLEQLLDILEIDESEQHELLALRDAARLRGWWAAHPGLFDEELTRYYGMEWGAHTIRSYESVMMPGLLQGEEFIRALMNSRSATVAPVEAEERVRARLTRQGRLTDPDDPLHLSVVLGEAVLHQQLGGPEVLGRQLRHLVAVAERYPETVDIRVIPFADAGFVPAGSTFHLLDFDRPRLPTLAWYESAVFGETVVDDPARNQTRVRDLTYLFERMHREALGRAESLALIRDRAAALEGAR
ncbi:helix-turn-helix domain-containing protein [Nocardia sp. NPDC057353]|uniref:helix-turn-helix domain-containing protein n=1 Tax=Nocardia sp. NPDC057353 TaxID=3346104 RepID=UPI00363B2CB0